MIQNMFKKKTNNIHPESVTKRLTHIFRIYSLPSVIHSYKGPLFDSFSFRTFSERKYIRHTTYPSHYPRSNRVAGRNLLKK